MWTPPERIKYSLPQDTIPTVDEANSSILFSPLRLRSGLLLNTRAWVPAMVPWRATEQGFVTQRNIDWYGRFARGKPGAIVIEATGVRDIPSGPLLRIGHDRFGPGLKKLVEAVREQSEGNTRLFIQLIDFLRIRRRPERMRYFDEFLRITQDHRLNLARLLGEDALLEAPEAAIRSILRDLDDKKLQELLSARELESLRMGFRERVTDMEEAHIRSLPEVLPPLFAKAAQRAREAGFDGVELHYAHAYTMASFLSALNQRGDAYGGARENRARLPLEVYAAVRKAVGSDYTVGCRFLCDEAIAGGNGVEDAQYFGIAFAQAGMDFLSLSTGGKFEDAKQPKVGEAAYPYTGPSGYECMPTVFSDARGPFGRNVGKQALVRKAVREAGFYTPVVAAGGICTFAQAEAILRQGDADLIGAARQSLADPDWFLKIRLGRGDLVRRCKYTNYCEALDQHHKIVTCQLWDRQDVEGGDVSLSDDGKRRLTAPIWKP